MVGFNNAKSKLSKYGLSDSDIQQLYQFDKQRAKALDDGFEVLSVKVGSNVCRLVIEDSRFVLKDDNGELKVNPKYSDAIACLVEELKKL